MDIFSLKKPYLKLSKQKNKFFSDKFSVLSNKKIGMLSLVVIFLLVISYVFYSVNKIGSLSKTNSLDSLELFILKQSVAIFKENKEKDHEALVSLSKRVDHILRFGSDDSGSSLTQVNTVPVSTNEKIQPRPSVSISSNQNQSIFSVTTPTPQDLGQLGTLEVYDPESMTVMVYKDASTVSLQSSVKVGITVPYFKKETDWYLIETQSNPQQLWWIYFKNVRGVR